MYDTVKRRVQIFKVKVQSNVVDGFCLDLKCINGEKDTLTYLPNPRIKALKAKYSRFREFTMLGWILTGRTMDTVGGTEKIFLKLSPKGEFEKMCSIEVLSNTQEALTLYEKAKDRLRDGGFILKSGEKNKEELAQEIGDKECDGREKGTTINEEQFFAKEAQ
eukprot:gene3863-biopygen1967